MRIKVRELFQIMISMWGVCVLWAPIWSNTQLLLSICHDCLRMIYVNQQGNAFPHQIDPVMSLGVTTTNQNSNTRISSWSIHNLSREIMVTDGILYQCELLSRFWRTWCQYYCWSIRLHLIKLTRMYQNKFSVNLCHPSAR